jgi:SAM-dependent methyltransferase
MIRRLLAHPLTRNMDLDSPETTQLRKKIISSKPFLKRIYDEWYALHSEQVTSLAARGRTLELGSGAGFISDQLSDAITSDIFKVDGIEIVLDAQNLPFKRNSLKAILMTNVLHHIPHPGKLFDQAARCLVQGGAIVMIEPWLTGWSRFVYANLHHEPLDDKVDEWKIDSNGPLSSANSALPWVIFNRDYDKFQKEFPQFRTAQITPIMPFRYLVSGGISLRNLMPEASFRLWRGFENMLKPWMDNLGMFAKIVLVRS